MYRSPSLALLLALVLLAAPAAAEMQLDRSILVFDADGAPRQDVEVTNSDDAPLYLDTEVLLVTAPGTDAEARTAVDDPGAAGILVTPARAVVPPGGRQLLRIVLLEDAPAEDRIYRINVKPVLPPLQPRQTAVKVVVAYQLLVIQRPRDPAPDLVWSREGDRISFENLGNSNVVLFNGRQCADFETETDCTEIDGARRLYAGNRWTLDLPRSGPVEFTTGVGLANVRRRFD